MLYKQTLIALTAFSISVNAIYLDVNSVDSVRTVSSALAEGLVNFYNGDEPGNVPGILEDPYYWWNAGAMFDVLVQYSALTGDSKYNDITAQALAFQRGDDGSYMPRNQSRTIGNDDQSTWALAALSASEAGWTATNGNYLTSAKAVFDTQVNRWNESVCGGGLRWQIFSFNAGYNYKNAASNGQFFQLAARLARDTGNNTYTEWATKIFEWSQKVGFIDNEWNVYDGALADDNCQSLSRIQFSSNAGTYVAGLANLYNATGGASKWKDALDNLLDRTLNLFFPNGIATEIACESVARCNRDQENFKGLLAHQLVDTIWAAPYNAAKIRPLLTTSAEAAARACASSGEGCRVSWNGTSSGSSGSLGPQLSALSFVQSLLFGNGTSPAASNTTGTNPTQSASQTTTTSSSSTTPLQPNSATTFAPAISACMFIGCAFIALAVL